MIDTVAHELRNEMYFSKQSSSRAYFVVSMVSAVSGTFLLSKARQTLSLRLLHKQSGALQFAYCNLVAQPAGVDVTVRLEVFLFHLYHALFCFILRVQHKRFFNSY